MKLDTGKINFSIGGQFGSEGKEAIIKIDHNQKKNVVNNWCDNDYE